MNEVERYNQAWETGDYDPMIGLLYTRCLYRTFFFDDYNTILDVGCGTGAAVRYHREIGEKEAYGIDFAEPATKFWDKLQVKDWCTVASAEDIPYKDNTFDMVTCTDVLEHIPESSVVKVLQEMLRVGKNFFFTVALVPAKHKMPHDGSEPHICLKPAVWWIKTMGEAGYRFPTTPYVARFTLMVRARKVENQHRRDKSLQQKLLYLPNERQIQRVYFPNRVYAH
jgi:SAM-dependent methyltransferase